jgi:hypothetical protein
MIVDGDNGCSTRVLDVLALMHGAIDLAYAVSRNREKMAFEYFLGTNTSLF